MSEYMEKDFELPSNIRQIGTIGSGLRVYIEDYVHTYLNLYAGAGTHCEKIAFLIGRQLVIDGIPYVFISGAVQGRYSEYAEGIETFTKKSLEYASEQISQFFSGYEIVGWMQSQPGYGAYLNPFYGEYHMENFTKKTDLLFVIDPVERTSEFYRWNEDMTALVEARGYFVYYDKNEGMNEYMLENKLTGAAKEKELVKAEPPAAVRREAKDERNAPARTPARDYQRRNTVRTPKYLEKNEASPPAGGNRLAMALVASLAILFVVTLAMGAGLLQNRERVTKLEENLTVMSTAYNYLSNQLKMISSQAVFAPDDSMNTPEESQAAENTQTAVYTTPPESVNTALTSQNAPSETPTQASQHLPSETPAQVFSPEPSPVVIQTGRADIPDTYTVEQGDNLIFISNKFYGTPDMVDAIMELNGLSDADTIFFGKVLKLPK